MSAMAGGSPISAATAFYWRIANSTAIPMSSRSVAPRRHPRLGRRTGRIFHALVAAMRLWRRNGRPPQLLCGVGFSAQGMFGDRITGACPARRPARRVDFEGINDEIIAISGCPGGVAAGFELDRADFKTRHAANTLILARSERTRNTSSRCLRNY